MELIILIMAICWLVTLILVRHMAYRHGIWDGAFNHFLPIVQKEMLYYDKHRAKAILEKEGFNKEDDWSWLDCGV